MTSEEYQWYIKVVRDRYQHLDLTFEQAEQIYRFEQDRDDLRSEKYIFSVWEESDYEMSVFKGILDKDQWKTYEAQHLDQIKTTEQSLMEQDAKKGLDIRFAEDRFNYYENTFLPNFYDPKFWQSPILPWERNKIDFLKKEYKRFVDGNKKRVLVEHFRENRLFMPNQLKFSLLWQQVDYLWPSYLAFQAQMDEPTRAMDSYLRAKVGGYQDKADFLDKKLAELAAFNVANYNKHYKDQGGWRSITPLKNDSDEVRRDGLMALILLDRNKYDLNK